MNNFCIVFDFDCEGDPPVVFIADSGECCYVEVLEEPILQAEEWSCEPEDWEPGPIATALVDFMNSAEYNNALQKTAPAPNGRC